MEKIITGDRVVYVVGAGTFSNIKDALIERSKHANPQWSYFKQMVSKYPGKYRVNTTYDNYLGTRFMLQEIKCNDLGSRLLGIKPVWVLVDQFWTK